MTTPEQRYAHWADALHAWNGAQDALQGALARYVEGYPLPTSPGVLRRHVGEALAEVTGALAGLQRALDCEGEDEQS